MKHIEQYVGRDIFFGLGAACLIGFALLLTGCSSTPKAAEPPAPQAEQPLGPHEATAARALALQKIGESATDGETKRMAIMAVALMGQGGGGGNGAPPPQVVQAPSIGGIVLGVVDRLLGISPAWFAYKSSIRNSQTTETVAAINRDVSIAQSNNFTQLGIAGVNGTAAVGISGMNSLATVASHPTTSIAITGNQGPVNNGTGTQTNSSNNPVNPAPKVCAVTATGVLNCP